MGPIPCSHLLALPVVALALAAVTGAQHAELEPGVVSRSDEVAVRLTGRVQRPDGAAAAGAVVVTTLGGEAVTGADGRFELALDVPPEVQALQVTAVATLRGASHTATAILPATAPVDAGTLVLAIGTGCAPSWIPTFGPAPGVDEQVRALAVFDDGGGPALYVGGDFSVAGGVAASRIARWDGSSWSPLGTGIDSGSVYDLAVFDDGSGPALYVGGLLGPIGGQHVGHVARWDGTSWSALGSGVDGGVFGLTVFDDGGGSALYVGGVFRTAGGVPANHVAKWDGSSWSPLGSGTDAVVHVLQCLDDGGGPALYVGGGFSVAGGIPADHVARWDGSGWSPLGLGLEGKVFDLEIFDDGGGPALYAGGSFTTRPYGSLWSNVARWDGSSWSAPGTGIGSPGDTVHALEVFDDGGGPALYAGGSFGPAHLARWDGSSWSEPGGLTGWGSFVGALAVHDDGGGPALFVGGWFQFPGGVGAKAIAEWDGSSWSPLGTGLNAPANALTVFDDGGGPALYAGGSFTHLNGVVANRVARVEGTSWSPLGTGVGFAGAAGSQVARVSALAVFDDGGGPALYAGGIFTQAGGVAANHVARWDGTTWTPLGGGLSGAEIHAFENVVFALAVFDDGSGPALYAGGAFTQAGGAAANFVARWDGSSWSPLGSGMEGSFLPVVHALAVFDDGGGPALYAGGMFTTAGGVPANSIARWDGASWSPLGSGIDKEVRALEAFDDGTGPALYAGGGFTTAGGVSASCVARWDGASWSALGSGIDATSTIPRVFALEGLDDGTGPALYAGGWFYGAGGFAVKHVARWDGSSWSSLGAGMDGAVIALSGFDDGDGPALYAGGTFTSTVDSGDGHLAKWGCSPFAPIPGCAGNPATLSAPSQSAKIGASFSLQLDGGTFASGTAFLLAGGDGTDPAGCGLVVPGIGELLLALAPSPVLVAQEATAGGSATFSVAVPANPAWVGLTIAVQAIHLGALPASPIEASTGLAVTFSG